MTRILRKFLILCMICLCCCSTVYAKEGIEAINIDVYINEFGDATVTEIWRCEAYSGTEWYHPYYNLGNAEIKDLSVRENGEEYSFISNWSTSASHSYKTGKCGFHWISDGIEICWGMGEYGKHEYEVRYTITNFVDQLNDSQMIYWTLIPHGRSDAVDYASIKIHADKSFEDDTPVWGFGDEGGVCDVQNGCIVMSSKNGLKTSEYMTVLGKFPDNFFVSSNYTNEDFEYYHEMAMKDARKLNEDLLEMIGIIIVMMLVMSIYIFLPYVFSIISKGFEKLGTKFSPIVTVIAWILFMTLGAYGLIIAFIIAVIAEKTIKEHKVIKDVIYESKVEYYRDIPCNKNLFKSYYIGYQYGIIKKETDLLGAIILKWIKEQKAYVIDKNLDLTSDCIQLSNKYNEWDWDNENEKELYKMMYQASGDGNLERKELEKWCKNKYSSLFTWFKSVILHEQNLLVESGELIRENNGKYKETPQLLEEGKRIAGLKKYLKDFSLIHEREAVEIHLFEDYLILAQMMGIAKKVATQFKELYPDVIERSNFDYGDYIFVHSISHRSVRRATRARANAETLKRMASSGGGGRSFGGGGGGSRGGGRGGGGRR